MGGEMRRALVVAACLVVSASAGCKGNKLSAKKLESSLMTEIEKTTGKKPTSVTCPSDISKKDGTTTTCDVVAPDGSPAKVNVTMTGGDTFKWEIPATGPAQPPVAAPEFLTIPSSAVEIEAPAGWARKQDGDWGLLTSPDKKAVLAFVAFSRPNESTARIGQISRVLGASTVNWGAPKRGTVGPDNMPANVADGSCLFNGQPSAISYATVNPGGSTQILVVYATNNDVPPVSKQQGLETFKSLRRKR